MLNRLLYTCAVSALALGIAAPAVAQTAPAATPAPTATPEDTGDDIVVTAQGRSQLLANVPLAVSAVTAQSLAQCPARTTFVS